MATASVLLLLWGHPHQRTKSSRFGRAQGSLLPHSKLIGLTKGYLVPKEARRA